MSFSSTIKQEIAYNQLEDCCTISQLCALVVHLASIQIKSSKMNLVVKSVNPTTIKRFVQLYKKLFTNKSFLQMVDKQNLKKNKVYMFVIEDDVKEFLEKIKLYDNGFLTRPKPEVYQKDHCARSYIAGAFLAYGSCNDPSITKNYNLEFVSQDEQKAKLIKKLLLKYVSDVKIRIRRNRYIVYVKKADQIADILRLIGASDSLMKFENIRISRDMTNSMRRLENIDFANEKKTLISSSEQLEMCELLYDSNIYNTLDEKLKEVIELRKEFENESLQELCNKYVIKYKKDISKSGLKHRFDKIREIVKKYERNSD